MSRSRSRAGGRARSCLRGGLARDPGDASSPVGAWHARVHPQGTQDARGQALDAPQVVGWKLVYTRQAQKDAKKLSAAGLRPKAESLLKIPATNPFQNPPPFEKLVGDLAGAYSRRINIQHRLVYQVLKEEKTVKVLRLWTHYE